MKLLLFLATIVVGLLFLGAHSIAAPPQDRDATQGAKDTAKDVSADDAPNNTADATAKATDPPNNTADATAKATKKEADKAAKTAKAAKKEADKAKIAKSDAKDAEKAADKAKPTKEGFQPQRQ